MSTDVELAQRVKDHAWPKNVPVPKAPKLKLSGEDGNAFLILGRAKRAAEKAKWTPEQWDIFSSLARAGDYDHLLRVHMRYFDVR